MFIWDSEGDGIPIKVADKSCFGTTLIDSANGIYEVASYNTSGSHTTVLLFFGPNAKANYQKWNGWVKKNREEGKGTNINTRTSYAIKQCFDCD